MQGRTRGDSEIRVARGPECVHQLIEKERHTRVDFGWHLRGLRPSGYSLFAARDDLIAVGDDKFVEHTYAPFRRRILCCGRAGRCRKLNRWPTIGPVSFIAPRWRSSADAVVREAQAAVFFRKLTKPVVVLLPAILAAFAAHGER